MKKRKIVATITAAAALTAGLTTAAVVVPVDVEQADAAFSYGPYVSSNRVRADYALIGTGHVILANMTSGGLVSRTGSSLRGTVTLPCPWPGRRDLYKVEVSDPSGTFTDYEWIIGDAGCRR